MGFPAGGEKDVAGTVFFAAVVEDHFDFTVEDERYLQCVVDIGLKIFHRMAFVFPDNIEWQEGCQFGVLLGFEFKTFKTFQHDK